MGMVLGLIPIVGAPLPIMSYGGSSMMAIMMGLGIVMSCGIHKEQPIGWYNYKYTKNTQNRLIL